MLVGRGVSVQCLFNVVWFNQRNITCIMYVCVCVGTEDDGGQQLEGHAAAADRGQDDPVRGQGRGREDLVRGVLQRGGQHRHTQEDGRRRVDVYSTHCTPRPPPRPAPVSLP